MKNLANCPVYLALLVTLFGCQDAHHRDDSAQLSAVRDRYVLANEPAGVEGVLDIQETYEAPRDVAIVGQIGGVDNPWTNGKAAFILADPITLLEKEAAAEEHICEDPGCKFCARKKINKLKEGLAVVEFKDGEGEILPFDARRLFNVSERQMVVVRGRAHVNEIGCLVIAADGLYIRR